MPLDLEYHSVCPLVRIGTLPPPLPQASVSPPRTKGGRTHLPAGEGVGEPEFRRLGEKPSTLSTLLRLARNFWSAVKYWTQSIDLWLFAARWVQLHISAALADFHKTFSPLMVHIQSAKKAGRFNFVILRCENTSYTYPYVFDSTEKGCFLR